MLAGAVAGGVEGVGGLGVGVIVEEPVEQGEYIGVGLAGGPGGGRDGDGQAGGLPAAEADVEVDLVGLGQGDVVDEQPGHALALALGGGWVGPQGGEVGGEAADAGLVLVAERGGCGGGPLVVVLGGLQLAQSVVPVGFEAVGHEPVVGVHGQVAAAGELGAVAGAFDVAAPQGIGFLGAGFEFGLHGERDFEGEGGDGVQQELADGGVDAGAGDGLTAWPAGLDGFADALVVGHLDAAALVVAHGHAPPAACAHGEALQQRGALAGRAGGAFAAVRLGVAGQ